MFRLTHTQGHTKVLANTPRLVKHIGCLKDDGWWLMFVSPHSTLRNPKIMETKKDVGVMSLALTYPYLQALALPLCEDKQRRACPRQVII